MPSESEKWFGRKQRSTHDQGSTLKPDPTEAYKAIRAHELMLNEAAAAQERSVIPPLLTLNGVPRPHSLLSWVRLKATPRSLSMSPVARWPSARGWLGLS